MPSRKLTRVVIEHGNPGKVRYTVKVTGEVAPKNSHIGSHIFFIKWLGDNPYLLECGPASIDSLKIKHQGEFWEAVGESIADENTLEEA